MHGMLELGFILQGLKLAFQQLGYLSAQNFPAGNLLLHLPLQTLQLAPYHYFRSVRLERTHLFQHPLIELLYL